MQFGLWVYSHGPVHAEFRINDDGVWPLEVAPGDRRSLRRSLRFSFDVPSEPIGLEELLLSSRAGTPGWRAYPDILGLREHEGGELFAREAARAIEQCCVEIYRSSDLSGVKCRERRSMAGPEILQSR